MLHVRFKAIFRHLTHFTLVAILVGSFSTAASAQETVEFGKKKTFALTGPYCDGSPNSTGPVCTSMATLSYATIFVPGPKGYQMIIRPIFWDGDGNLGNKGNQYKFNIVPWTKGYHYAFVASVLPQLSGRQFIFKVVDAVNPTGFAASGPIRESGKGYYVTVKDGIQTTRFNAGRNDPEALMGTDYTQAERLRLVRDTADLKLSNQYFHTDNFKAGATNTGNKVTMAVGTNKTEILRNRAKGVLSLKRLRDLEEVLDLSDELGVATDLVVWDNDLNTNMDFTSYLWNLMGRVPGLGINWILIEEWDKTHSRTEMEGFVKTLKAFLGVYPQRVGQHLSTLAKAKEEFTKLKPHVPLAWQYIGAAALTPLSLTPTFFNTETIDILRDYTLGKEVMHWSEVPRVINPVTARDKLRKRITYPSAFGGAGAIDVHFKEEVTNFYALWDIWGDLATLRRFFQSFGNELLNMDPANQRVRFVTRQSGEAVFGFGTPFTPNGKIAFAAYVTNGEDVEIDFSGAGSRRFRIDYIDPTTGTVGETFYVQSDNDWKLFKTYPTFDTLIKVESE
ncbi:hypothetical protein OAO01_01330 [Oligoflexia bacterium]|nr:hypothetical protein [Oligoflexia bacterium]